ncbi:MAG: aldehyde dehydrogenase family protein [Candidatus Schekmanbacteria bacterium]|nr:aldehyde dehydrogenase family protein [Candidatus Schekmanbacteria bacterium]
MQAEKSAQKGGAHTLDDVKRIFETQRANRWNVAKTTAADRIAKLVRIREALLAQREDLQSAIYQDYKKNPGEVDLTEVFPTISDINHTVKHLPRWMKPHKVGTPLVLFGTHSEVRYEAKGIVLILGPWNYPFQLLMIPLVTAIAAGNCAMVKASSKVPHTARFIRKFLSGLFQENEVAVIEGGHDTADALLELPFDHIFFTGSPSIGKKVMGCAAKHLTSVTLELGGKSPVIVDATANIEQTAERVMWGKFINAGQTCVAPDYLLVHQSRESALIEECKKVIQQRFGRTAEAREKSPDFCRLVSHGHFDALKRVLDSAVADGARVEIGGEARHEDRYLAPTLLSGVTPTSPIMREEIFGPILPILSFSSLEEAIEVVRAREKPLALYIFSQDENNVENILRNTTAGGTCVNSLIVHLANTNLPFGGVGNSGMGNYHGFFGFRSLSHERAVLRQGFPDSLKFFYPPYTPRVKKMIELAMRYIG